MSDHCGWTNYETYWMSNRYQPSETMEFLGSTYDFGNTPFDTVVNDLAVALKFTTETQMMKEMPHMRYYMCYTIVSEFMRKVDFREIAQRMLYSYIAQELLP